MSFSDLSGIERGHAVEAICWASSPAAAGVDLELALRVRRLIKARPIDLEAAWSAAAKLVAKLAEQRAKDAGLEGVAGAVSAASKGAIASAQPHGKAVVEAARVTYEEMEELIMRRMIEGPWPENPDGVVPIADPE